MKCIAVPLFILLFQISYAQDKTYYVRPSGKLPQLAYSTGEDRLGSAKMGYIDTTVALEVIDSIKNLYQVRLSSMRSAYIEKISTVPLEDTIVVLPGPYLCESWSVKGSDSSDHDIVTINITGRPAYKSWMEIDPARIKIELYNVQSNTNWITQLKTAKAVKNVWYEQVDDDVVQITIDLKYRQHYGYRIGYNGKALQLFIRRQPVHRDISKLVIAIDAGHGGTNIGATGTTTGIYEKNYTLLFAKELEKILKKQRVKVVMIRTEDSTIDNKDRILTAIEKKVDLYVSFHLNSGRAEARGVSTYYKHLGYRPFTEAILKRLLAIRNLPDFGNIGSFNFQPVQPTEYPSCLVEVAFLSNVEDERMILKQSFRAAVANQVFLGIKDWFRELK